MSNAGLGAEVDSLLYIGWRVSFSTGRAMNGHGRHGVSAAPLLPDKGMRVKEA